MMTPKFAAYDGYATRFTSIEAWVLTDKREWHRIHAGQILHEAALLTEERYHRIFGDVPPLPSDTFQPKPWRSPLV
jgi:hypothetical protein